MENFTDGGTVGVLVMGLTEIFKKIGIASKYLPFVAVLLGALIQMCQQGFTLEQGILGAVAGATATGVVSLGKNIVNKK